MENKKKTIQRTVALTLVAAAFIQMISVAFMKPKK